MNIAYIVPAGRGDTDFLLHAFAQQLIAEGYRPCGVVQFNSGRADEGPCDMDVQVLPEGPFVRISQTLGRHSKGCRLDPGALETSVGLVGGTLAGGADCLIINKFGKQEAGGGGFRTVIADALASDIPVLVGLNRLNAADFHTFTGGLAEEIPACRIALKSWFEGLKRGVKAV